VQVQIQLMTRLAKLEEVVGTAVRDTFRLLVDDAAPIRHAAAELVADLLPDFGERQLQVAVCMCFYFSTSFQASSQAYYTRQVPLRIGGHCSNIC
jgi:hypothetical protein